MKFRSPLKLPMPNLQGILFSFGAFFDGIVALICGYSIQARNCVLLNGKGGEDKMKKVITALAIVIFLLSFVASSGESLDRRYCYGRWVLCDNFNSGYINPYKWDTDESSAKIYVENGRVRFDHNTAQANVSSWLIFKKYPEKIKAIRASVKIIEGASGDSRARIGGWAGKDDDGNPIWNNLQIRNENKRIDCYAGAIADPPEYNTVVYDLFYAYFKSPIEDLNDCWQTITMYFYESMLLYEAYRLGTIEYMIPQRMQKFDDVFKGIGTRNSYVPETDGIFSVYFDNVYVMY